MTRLKAKAITKRLSLQVPEVLYEAYMDLTGSDISDIEKLLTDAMKNEIRARASECRNKMNGLDLAAQVYHKKDFSDQEYQCADPDSCPICTAISDTREQLEAIADVLYEVEAYE